MFLHVSVILFRGGVLVSVPGGCLHPGGVSIPGGSLGGGGSLSRGPKHFLENGMSFYLCVFFLYTM